MKAVIVLRNFARYAEKAAKKSEQDAKKLMTKACLNERNRIKRQIAFKSAGKKGNRSKPGERPRTVGGKLNRMTRVTIYPTSNGNAKVTIAMHWKAPSPGALRCRYWNALLAKRRAENRPEDVKEVNRKVAEMMRLYKGQSPAIALDRGFGKTEARPFIDWIKENVTIDMKAALVRTANKMKNAKVKKKR
jgi:hypothetical protein